MTDWPLTIPYDLYEAMDAVDHGLISESVKRCRRLLLRVFGSAAAGSACC